MPIAKKRYLIVGGGITGLTLAYYLKKFKRDEIDLTLYEASHRLGGWISTTHEQGYLFEQGPRSCRLDEYGYQTLQLIEDLKLQDQVITPSSYANQRYLYYSQQLRPLPTDFWSWLKSPFFKLSLQAIWQDVWTKPLQQEETIAQFSKRHFGNQVTELFLDSLTSGIYAGDIEHLSMSACFPKLSNLSQAYGSILRGMFLKKKDQRPKTFLPAGATLFSLKKGLQSLIEALGTFLKNEIQLQKTWSGQQEGFDKIFITAPFSQIAPYFIKQPDLADLLKSVKYTSLAVVNLGYPHKVFDQEGFGYLIPSREQEQNLGVIWDSSVFPEQNQGEQTRLTVMIGGEHFKDFKRLDENDFKEIAVNAVKRQLGIKILPDYIHCKISQEAIPQFYVGHHQKQQQIHDYLQQHNPQLEFMNTALHGVSVNQCIAQAKKKALT